MPNSSNETIWPETETQIYPKELSWLSFNDRVLQEAEDDRNPLIARLQFLGIFSSNQDEFFKVRMADVRRASMFAEDSRTREEAQIKLKEIHRRNSESAVRVNKIHATLMAELKKAGIVFKDSTALTKEQSVWVREHFRDNILRHIVPIQVTEKTDFDASLEDGVSYLMVQLERGVDIKYAIIDVPSSVARFLRLPDRGNKNTFMVMDDVIRHCLDIIFAGFYEFDHLDAWSMKFSRDAEYTLDDDVELSLIDKLNLGIKQRLHAEPVRLSYDETMPSAMLDVLIDRLGISKMDSLIAGGRYRNYKDFIGFKNPAGKTLEYASLPPIPSAQLERHTNMFAAMRERDVLLHYPYQSFGYFTEFVRQSASDPAVTRISLNIYRAASNSRVVESLADAVKNGKKVNVNIELRARFDEEHNLNLTETLTKAGVKVTLGIPALKVHSKLCLVARLEDGKERLYSVIATGNFNEKTANIYTDLALFTCHPEICREVSEVFRFIETGYQTPRLEHLLVSPLNNRRQIARMIRLEMFNARREDRPAWIKLKVNNLADNDIIQALYDASAAGVQIDLVVRGMCELVPGIKGLSENIRVTSIVDRFLEHPRIFAFCNNGTPKVYISSSDLMTRNLDHRVEVSCPILDPQLRLLILDMLELQIQDNQKARIIDKTQNNEYVKRGNKKKVRAQIDTYQLLKDWEANQHEPK